MRISGFKRRVERLAPEKKEPITIRITRYIIREKAGDGGKPVAERGETKTIVLK